MGISPGAPVRSAIVLAGIRSSPSFTSTTSGHAAGHGTCASSDAPTLIASDLSRSAMRRASDFSGALAVATTVVTSPRRRGSLSSHGTRATIDDGTRLSSGRGEYQPRGGVAPCTAGGGHLYATLSPCAGPTAATTDARNPSPATHTAAQSRRPRAPATLDSLRSGAASGSRSTRYPSDPRIVEPASEVSVPRLCPERIGSSKIGFHAPHAIVKSVCRLGSRAQSRHLPCGPQRTLASR